jgi:hypothetical protein
MYVAGEMYFNASSEIETSFDWSAYRRNILERHHIFERVQFSIGAGKGECQPESF